MTRGALALGVGVVLVLLLPVLTPDRTLVFRDALPYAAPQNRVHHAALSQGRLPEWDPSQYAGVPFLAAPPNQALYPPRWAATLLASPTGATELLVVLHLLLALAGGLLLGRELGLGRPARTVLALTYLLSGPLLSLLENLPSLTGACWLPLSLALLLRARRRGDERGWLLAAAGLALPFYGGATQAVAWLLVAGVLIALWPTGRSLRERAGSASLLLGCAAALGAALLLPAAWVFPETTRGGLSLTELGTWSFHPGRLIELLIPFPLGLPFGDRGDYLAPALEPRARELWAHTLFLGAVPALLAARALGRVPARLRFVRNAALVVAGLGLLLAAGRHTPAFELLARTPYGVFRYPEKHLLLVALAGACLAGVGVQALLADRPWRSRPQLLPLLVVPVLALAVGALAGLSSGRLAASLSRAAPPILPDLAAVVLAQLAALALLALPRLSRRRRGLALCLLVAATGLASARPLIHTGDARIASTPPPAVAWLRANVPALRQPLPPRIARVPAGPFGRSPADLTPSEARAAVMLMTLQGASARSYGLEGLGGLTGFRPRRVDALLRQGGATALARGAAPLVIGPTGHHQAEQLADVGLGVSLYQVPARPRVELGSGRIEAVRRPRPERIELELSCPEATRLVVRDAWFPGWTATVDGRPVPLEVADEAFMGLSLPAGARRVVLTYRTPGLVAGLVLAVPAWLLLLAFVLGLDRFRAGAQPRD